MKKRSIIFVVSMLLVVVAISIFAIGCQKLPESVSVIAPDGAAALAVAKLLEEKTINDMPINVKIVPADQIATESLKADFAVMPSNLAAKIFNEGSPIKVLDIVTNGNLYVIGNSDSVVDFTSLSGKMVFSIGQGSVPDLIFQSILKANNLEINFADSAVDGKVTIRYFKDGGEVIANLVAQKQKGVEAFGIVGEPAASKAKTKGLVEKFDIQQMWKAQTGSTVLGFPQAVLTVNGEASKNDLLIKKVRAILTNNDEWLVGNSAKAIENIKAVYGQTSLPATMSAEVIARCNVKTLSVASNKQYYTDMLDAIMKINGGKAIGGALPAESFYYAK